MKKILIRTAAAAVNVFLLYVFAMAAFLTLAFTTTHPSFEINGNGNAVSGDSKDNV